MSEEQNVEYVNLTYKPEYVQSLQAKVECLEKELAMAHENYPAVIRGQTKQIEALEKAINKVYPTIAGRVIQLQHGGETTAFKEWNIIAVTLHTALAATTPKASQQPATETEA